MNLEQTLTALEQKMDAIDSKMRFMLSMKDVFTLEEAALYSGRFSVKTIRKHCLNGNIKHSKPNDKDIFIARKDFEAWLMSKATKSRDELEMKAASYVEFNLKRKKAS